MSAGHDAARADLRPGLERALEICINLAAGWGGDIPFRWSEDAIRTELARTTPAPEGAQATPPASAAQLAAALREMLRLADMGVEDSLKEPEENGNFAAYNRAKEALTAWDATRPADQPAAHAPPGGARVVCPGAAFSFGQVVEKHTGDYQLPGTVQGFAVTTAGKVRYVVEHSPGFLHVYGEQNLRPAKPAPLPWDRMRALLDKHAELECSDPNEPEPVHITVAAALKAMAEFARPIPTPPVRDAQP